MEIRRPINAMPGHAFALSWKHKDSHDNDALRMRVYTRLRGKLNVGARHALLAGIIAPVESRRCP